MESSDEEEEQQGEQHVSKRAVQKNASDKWKNGKVPYVLAKGLRKFKVLSLNRSDTVKVIDPFFFTAKAQVNAINNAIGIYKSKTCIRFVARKKEKDYVRFIKGDG